jgi:hypothetical protein
MKKRTRSLEFVAPDVAVEWHPTKNGDLDPEKISYGSTKKVWWQCSFDQEHEWLATPNDRTKPRRPGCPYCSGRLVSPQTSIRTLLPNLIIEWDTEKNHPITPDDLSVGSNKKVWWICRNNNTHRWSTSPSERSKYGCPFCSGRYVTLEESLVVTHPYLVQEWHPTKNDSLTPDQVRSGSDRKIWWKCKKNSSHVWQALVRSRAHRGQRCPKCYNKITRPQIRLAAELEFIFGNVGIESRVGKDSVDILLLSHSIAIEFDGSYYHENKKIQDKQKTLRLRKRGLIIQRYRQRPLSKLTRLDVVVEGEELSKNELNKGLLLLQEKNVFTRSIRRRIKDYLNLGSFCNQDGYQNLLQQLPLPNSGSSFAELHPNAAKDWHSIKNQYLSPGGFTAGSGQLVWWKCRKCKFEWESRIVDRVRSGCRRCAGRVASRAHNLESAAPIFLAEWHPTKNGALRPSDVTPHSSKKVWWVCSANEIHEWRVSVGNRHQSGCPYCAGTRVNITNSLRTVRPDISTEWHPSRNAKLSPDDVSRSSGRKVWWQCKRGHEWRQIIAYRTMIRSGKPTSSVCRACSSIQYTHSHLAKEWMPRKNSRSILSVTHGSHFYAWWKCSICGFQWQKPVKQRTRGIGCPHCRGN